MNQNETIKKRSPQIRNVTFCVMVAVFAAFFLLGPIMDHVRPEGTNFNQWIDVHFTVFGVLGLVVLLLTVRLRENIMQKLFFILAGGAGAGFLTIWIHGVIDNLGRALFGPHPDGLSGGLLLGFFPIAFIIGALGSIVFLIKGRMAKNRSTP